MKTIAIVLLVCSVFGAVPSLAAEPEQLLVCGPCSRSFLDEARSVVEKLGVSDRVDIRRTSCLGACSEPAVMEFRGEIYTAMTADKLRSLLRCELGL
jgi:predicted metal-binding protein